MPAQVWKIEADEQYNMHESKDTKGSEDEKINVRGPQKRRGKKTKW